MVADEHRCAQQQGKAQKSQLLQELLKVLCEHGMREKKASKPKGMAGIQEDKLDKLRRLSKINMAKLRMCLVPTSEGEINVYLKCCVEKINCDQTKAKQNMCLLCNNCLW